MVDYSIAPQISEEDDSIIIRINDKEYEGTFIKIVDLRFNEETNEPEFELQLPTDKKEYFQDEKFIEIVQEVVGDVIKKATDYVWNEHMSDIMGDLELRIHEGFKGYDMKPDEGSSYIEMFANKGYVVSIDDNDELIAMKLDTQATYNFNKPEDVAFLKKLLTGSGIILH